MWGFPGTTTTPKAPGPASGSECVSGLYSFQLTCVDGSVHGAGSAVRDRAQVKIMGVLASSVELAEPSCVGKDILPAPSAWDETSLLLGTIPVSPEKAHILLQVGHLGLCFLRLPAPAEAGDTGCFHSFLTHVSVEYGI